MATGWGVERGRGSAGGGLERSRNEKAGVLKKEKGREKCKEKIGTGRA